MLGIPELEIPELGIPELGIPEPELEWDPLMGTWVIPCVAFSPGEMGLVIRDGGRSASERVAFTPEEERRLGRVTSGYPSV